MAQECSASSPLSKAKTGAAAHVEERGDPTVNASLQERKQRASDQMKQHACTLWNGERKTWEFRSIWKTSPKELGVYGMGVQLYFELLMCMGIAFLFLSIITLPMVVLNAHGNMVDATNPFYKFLAGFSLANVGYCPTNGCRTFEETRDRNVGENFRQKVLDWTEMMGLIDGVAIIVFVLFGAWFSRSWIPQQVEEADAKHITAADYAVEISGLPWKLEDGHENYRQKLTDHLLKVLKICGCNDANAIGDITLARDYGGAVRTFMRKGHMLKVLVEREDALRFARTNGKSEKEVANLEKKLEKQKAQIGKIDDHLQAEASMTDEQRGVCKAFVMFNSKSTRDLLLYEYRYATIGLFWLFQSSVLRFEGRRITVLPACEPGDLHWDNLDFSRWWRRVRKICVQLITLVLMVICTALLVAAQSITSVSNAVVLPSEVWVLKQTPADAADTNSACLRLCSLSLFTGPCVEDKGTSDDLPLDRIFNSDGDLPQANIGTSGDFSSCADLPPFYSGRCPSLPSQANGPTTADWIGVQFSSPETVRCLQSKYPRGSTVAWAAKPSWNIYACRPDVVPSSNDPNLVAWRPEQHCVAMETMFPKNVEASEPGIQASGRLKVHLDTSCQQEISFETAQQAKTLSGEDDPILACFCQQQVTKFGYDFRMRRTTDEEILCAEWSDAENVKVLKLLGGILAVNVLNQVHLFICQYLIMWERLCSITDVTNSEMIKTFHSLFANTGLLTLLVNMYIMDDSPVVSFLGIFGIGKGTYDDISATWYVAVGTAMFITIATQLFSNTMSGIASSFIVNPILIRFNTWGIRSQELLNKGYTFPEWNLALRLAQTMSMLFCIMMFSAGMPGLYWVGALYCFVAYWMDKWCLLHGSKRPPALNEQVIRQALRLFPLAAFLHAGFALWSFGQPSLVPSEWSEITPFFELLLDMDQDRYHEVRDIYMYGTEEEQNDIYQQYVTSRVLDCSRKACWLVLVVFCVIAVWNLLQFIWANFAAPVLSPFALVLRAFCCGPPKGNTGDASISLADAIPNMKRRGLLTSYHMDENVRYRDACIALQAPLTNVPVAPSHSLGVGQATWIDV